MNLREIVIIEYVYYPENISESEPSFSEEGPLFLNFKIEIDERAPLVYSSTKENENTSNIN